MILIRSNCIKFRVIPTRFQYQINDNDIELSYEKINYISNLIKALPNKDDISKFYTFNHQVDIQACINTTIDKWHYLLDSKNILTILNVEGNRIYWLGDQLWYERLFDNIISNVYKHSNSSRITIYLNEIILLFRIMALALMICLLNLKG